MFEKESVHLCTCAFVVVAKRYCKGCKKMVPIQEFGFDSSFNKTCKYALDAIAKAAERNGETL